MLGRLLDLLCLAGQAQAVLLLVVVRINRGQHMLESLHHLRTVLLEAVQTEGSDALGEAKHLTVDHGSPVDHRVATIVRTHHVRHLLRHAHYLRECDVPRVRDQGLPFRIAHRLLHNLHGLGIVEGLTPLGQAIRLGEQPLAVQLAVAHLPRDRVFGEDVCAAKERQNELVDWSLGRGSPWVFLFPELYNWPLINHTRAMTSPVWIGVLPPEGYGHLGPAVIQIVRVREVFDHFRAVFVILLLLHFRSCSSKYSDHPSLTHYFDVITLLIDCGLISSTSQQLLSILDNRSEDRRGYMTQLMRVTL